MDTRAILTEAKMTTARSGGSGGQHVNKVETKVLLMFDVMGSQFLTDGQKSLLMNRLAGRLNKENVLQIVSQASRSQHRNRTDAEAKLIEVLRGALRPQKKRRFKAIKANPNARLQAKKRNADKKAARRKVEF